MDKMPEYKTNEEIKDEVVIVQPLRQQPYGNWEFEVKDLNGYVLVSGEPG